ncbi:aspartate/glutamate/hydantoin racemase [Synergistales bacterium]|nr:aspartate/glutamate/hydantoin racemase [Synergistales bacterium]
MNPPSIDFSSVDFSSLRKIVASDSRSRGASALCRSEFFRDAAMLLKNATRIVIITGFFIENAGAPETDGPPGAVILARALARAGRRVSLVTDSLNYDALISCSRSVGGPVAACVDDPEKIDGRADLLVFIERPGRAEDGRYYNMKGVDISSVVSPLDMAAFAALRRGRAVIGIGDGGNEAGTGPLRAGLSKTLPDYATRLCVVPSTVCLPVDISNWGAYALAAVFGAMYGKWLGLDQNEEEAMLYALKEARVIDGVLGVSGLSVDGASLEELNQVSFQIKNWYLRNFQV